MKTRKQKSPLSKRARQHPARKPKPTQRPTRKSARKSAQTSAQTSAKRGAAGRRPVATRRRRVAPKHVKSHIRPDRSVTLAAQCTVAEADALKSELTGRLDEPGAVTVDVSALERIDTAGLQLLAAFVRDRRTAGHAVEWRGQSSALEAAAGLLGLNNMLELPGEAGR